MRRFLMHVLPSGFHRIRHYGLIANAGRRENLARARELLNVPRDTDDPASAGDGVTEPVPPTYVCPDCGAPMIIIETLVRHPGREAPNEYLRPPRLPSLSFSTSADAGSLCAMPAPYESSYTTAHRR